MNLLTIATEIRTVAKTLGIRTPPWGAMQIQPPALIVPLPDRIEVHSTYGNGLSRIEDLPVALLIGNPTEPAAYTQIAAYTAGAGAKSLTLAFEGHTWACCDELTVTSIELGFGTYAGQEVLAAEFHLDIMGRRAAT